MRLVILAAAALALAGSAAAGAQPESGIRLERGEVLLEVEGEGSVRTPADVVKVHVPMFATGKTPAAARSAVDGLRARLFAAARAAGIAAGDIADAPAADYPVGFVGTEAMQYAAAAEGEARTYREQLTLEITLRDPASFERLRDALEAAGATDVSTPRYSLADEVPARRAAKAAALANARQEADAYARSLGMRVVRVVRVSERKSAAPFDFEQLHEMFRDARRGGHGSPDIETRMQVAVDFALAPNR